MTTPTPPDFKALCAELADWARMLVEVPDPPVTRSADELSDLLARARAALEAQPEPVGPTLDDVVELCAEHEFMLGVDGANEEESAKGLLEIARAVLARWGRPAIEPIPVSERLPEPKDCDVLGRCWMCGKVEGDWRLISTINPGVPRLKYTFSHWLPHWALPIPRSEENLGA